MLWAKITVKQAEEYARYLLRQNNTLNGLIAYASDRDSTYSNYQNVPPAVFSNENNSYFASIVPKRPFSAVVVAGSFDQIFDLALLGLKKVWAFDINPNQFFMGGLKMLAMQKLSFKEFSNFLIEPLSPLCFSKVFFEKIFDGEPKNEVETVIRVFWKILINAYRSPVSLRLNCLAFEKCFLENKSNRLLLYNYVKSAAQYKKTSEALKKVDIRFYDGDIFENAPVVLAEEKVDLILLSNLHNFSDPESYMRKYNRMARLVNTCGKIVTYCIQIPEKVYKDFDRGDGIIDSLKPNKDYNLRFFEGIQSQLYVLNYIYQNISSNYKLRLCYVNSGLGYNGVWFTKNDTVMVATIK